MTKMGSSYWSVGNFMVSYTNATTSENAEVLLDPTFVAETPIHFSFHCSHPAPVQPLNKTSSGVAGVSVKFIELQVRPWAGCIHTARRWQYLCKVFFCWELVSSIKDPLPSNRQHLISGACLEEKREDNQNCAVLCTTVVHSDTHTRVRNSYIFAC